MVRPRRDIRPAGSPVKSHDGNGRMDLFPKCRIPLPFSSFAYSLQMEHTAAAPHAPTTRDGLGRLALIVLVALASALSSCSTSRESTFGDKPERAAVDTPERFLVFSGAEDWTEPDGSTTCRSPIMDPRDGVSARLVRSVPGRGDYEFELGRYGIEAGELLRVDCRTGRSIGIVRR